MQEVTDYLENNLGLRKDLVNLKHFLSCKKFIDYACRGDKLNELDKVNYEKSWLFKHEMTLLEIESQTFGTVEEDQVLSSETVSSETESQSASTCEETNLVSILNFPLMGNVLLEIITEFCTEIL